MLLLLKIEWLKIKRYRAFWWMLAIILLSYPGINTGFYFIYKNITKGKDMANQLAKTFLGNPFSFPETWHTTAYFSSHFIFLPAILVIMLVTNEYSFKTNRQNIIDGWSRSEFISSKLIDVIIVSFIVTLVEIGVAIGFGFNTDAENWNKCLEQLYYIPLFYFQTFAQLSIAFILGYFIKKAFMALGIFLFYYLIVENILVGYLTVKNIPIARFLPFEVSDKILVSPAFVGNFGADAKTKYEAALQIVPEQILFTLIMTTLIWGVCYKVHQKRDIL